ncbi:heavy metal-associated isoprenylated plant protein 34 [Neltuma alba]|uniref:heavy metal-associated isoprenylated plant protein 34 n=1 Tax=Neltuma alba TaxID=207710 RepID=UPI0010A2D8E0|nr:heavy metal-associated isoprenylated plant protein 34-like [Prosopis alba]
MNKQDLLKIQSCVLKVNIHCDGCEHKVKKLLQKIDGVYSVNIDAEQGKVLVTGNVDPGTLIKKLKSSGKHAELWGPKGMMFPTNQFKNLQIDPHGKGGKDNKSHKGGKDNQKGAGQPQLFQFQNKGPHNFKLPAGDHKSVKFNLPGEEFDASDDDFDDDFDDYEDSEDDYKEEHIHTHAMPNKMMNGHKGTGGGGKNAKKIDVMDVPVQMKGKGGNNEFKNGGNGGKKNHGGGGKKNKSGGGGGNKKSTKTSVGLLGRFLGLGQKGGDKHKDKKKGGGGGGTGNNKKGKQGKKGGDKFEDVGYGFDDEDGDVDEFDIPQSHQGKGKGKGKGGNGGKSNNGKGNGNHGNVGQMGPIQMGHMDQMKMEQMRNLMQGLPAMNGGGYYPGMQMQPPPPQYQPPQQYMAPMMSHNYHQQPHLNSMYPPPAMMYGRPYMPPPPPIPVQPGADHVTHAFNDENTESCTVM